LREFQKSIVEDVQLVEERELEEQARSVRLQQCALRGNTACAFSRAGCSAAVCA
jgi:hypothetical protein